MAAGCSLSGPLLYYNNGSDSDRVNHNYTDNAGHDPYHPEWCTHRMRQCEVGGRTNNSGGAPP